MKGSMDAEVMRTTRHIAAAEAMQVSVTNIN